jgi:HSP20 family protein
MKSTIQNRPVDALSSQGEQYIAPDVNIYETAGEYVVEVEMPGVGKEELEITVEGNEIAIAGFRRKEAVTGKVLFSERRAENYRRVFELDPVVETGKISARVDQGILTLTLPKTEEVKPRKIAVE